MQQFTVHFDGWRIVSFMDNIQTQRGGQGLYCIVNDKVIDLLSVHTQTEPMAGVSVFFHELNPQIIQIRSLSSTGCAPFIHLVK